MGAKRLVRYATTLSALLRNDPPAVAPVTPAATRRHAMSVASHRPAVLVVAGEPSGDRIAADAARVLSARGVTCLGMGGEACVKAGVRLVADMLPAAMG